MQPTANLPRQDSLSHTRRSFCKAAASAVAANLARASPAARFATQHCPVEWSYQSGKPYSDPLRDVRLDVIFSLPSGAEQRVPAFWGGDSVWRIRYAPPVAGAYRFRSVCSDSSNGELHDLRGTIEVEPYAGGNPLYRHGPPRIAADHRHFAHTDGTPFFWLADTWWMGFCKRLSWPDNFERLTADRVQKGFTVVQIVAGLYPDMEPFDARGANEAGFSWDREFKSVNPAYFDMADLRIQHLVASGIVPCIVGCWGYFLPRMGVEKIKHHWRYIVGRWSAYPVIWCLAGEGTMPYYLSKTPAQDREAQKQGWSEVAHYLRSIDPSKHPITIHPSQSARDSVDDAALLDFDMLQTGHSDRRSIPGTIDAIKRSRASDPKMPVLVGEVDYEGIQEASREEVQRFLFWSCLLSGTAGHTYGANGIWQVNAKGVPYGLSPHGHSWGGPSWEEAALLPGSRQLGLGKALLLRYSWWKLEPAADLLDEHWSADDYWHPFAARIPGEAVIAFYPSGGKAARLQRLPAGKYRASFFNPSDGVQEDIGRIEISGDGIWHAPEFPIFRDWVLILDERG